MTGLVARNGAQTPLAANDGPAPSGFAKRRQSGPSHFQIYRADTVCLTSTLFGGGDWHWQLVSEADQILAECGGYRTERDCLAAVQALRSDAGSATVVKV